jgi:hypothetical protein
LRKALLPQELCDSQAPPAMVTVHDNGATFVRLQFCYTGRNFTHGYVSRARDAGRRYLIGLAAVEQNELVAAIEHLFHGANVGIDGRHEG